MAIFSNLSEAELRELVPGSTVRPFPKGAVLVNEGDTTNSLYILLSGRVKAFVNDENGAELVLNTIGAGDYFGELVLDGGPRSASIMATEPCRVLILPHGDVDRMLEHNPAFARDLMHKLISRVRSLTSKVTDLALKDTYGRFARFLEENSIEQDGLRKIPERLTQHDIAARIGGSREMVSRIIKELVAGGYISIESKYISVHKKLPARW